MGHVVVERMSALDESFRPQVARVFVEGYEGELAALSKDRGRWALALAPAFVAERFFVAIEDGQVLGIAACAHGTERAMRLDARAFRAHLGLARGTLAHLLMRRGFHHALPYPPTTGYVECVATARHARGRGVATGLLTHIHRLPYEEFVLEVTDVNSGALRLYERLGYRELRRTRSRLPWLTGHRYALFLRRSGGPG